MNAALVRQDIHKSLEGENALAGPSCNHNGRRNLKFAATLITIGLLVNVAKSGTASELFASEGIEKSSVREVVKGTQFTLMMLAGLLSIESFASAREGRRIPRS